VGSSRIDKRRPCGDNTAAPPPTPHRKSLRLMITSSGVATSYQFEQVGGMPNVTVSCKLTSPPWNVPVEHIGLAGVRVVPNCDIHLATKKTP
jgi:hypothetical protein